jgi:hypothetical protein
MMVGSIGEFLVINTFACCPKVTKVANKMINKEMPDFFIGGNNYIPKVMKIKQIRQVYIQGN